jgi:hypothetical protein
MAITHFADRCRQTSVTTGTGALTLAAADTGYRPLSALYAVSEDLPYCIEGHNADGTLSGQWEVGRGHLDGSGHLVRDTVFASSAGGLINFSSNNLVVFITASADALTEVLTSALTGSGATGEIAFWTGAAALSGDATFFWNNSTKQLGVGTASPNEKATVEGRLSLRETTAPSATANYGKLYVKSSDSTLYFMDDSGVEHNLLSGGGGMSIGGAVTSGTVGSLLFVATGPVLAQDNANLFWDNTNKRLGIGNATPAHTVDIVTGTLADTKKALSITGTFPSSTTAAQIGASMTFTTAGSAANDQRGLQVVLASGYTGANNTYTGLFINNAASSDTHDPITNPTLFGSAAGVFAAAHGTSTGNRVGAWGSADTGTTNNIGVLGYGWVATGMSGLAYGTIGIATAAGGQSGVGIGGYFALAAGGGTITPSGSAALVADNQTIATSIFIARDNGTAVFSVIDDGAVEMKYLSAPATPAAGYGRLYAKSADGHVYWKDAGGTEYDLTSGGGGGGMSIGGAVTSATAGSVLFAATGPVLAQDNATFFWDNTNKRLGIGTNAPVSVLHVKGNPAGITSENTSSTGYGSIDVTNDAGHYVQLLAGGSGVGATWFPSGAAISRADVGGFRAQGLAALMLSIFDNVPFYLGQNDRNRLDFMTGEAVFNNQAFNYDFRVEGQTAPDLLFVDASADTVQVGTGTSVATVGLTVFPVQSAAYSTIRSSVSNSAHQAIIQATVEAGTNRPQFSMRAYGDTSAATGMGESIAAKGQLWVFNGAGSANGLVVGTDSGDIRFGVGAAKLLTLSATGNTVDVIGGTLASTKQALAVTATLASAAATQFGIYAAVTSAGSANGQQLAAEFDLLAGYTGALSSYGFAATNAAAGTNTGAVTGFGGSTTGGNYAGYFSIGGTNTAGDNIGLFAAAKSSSGLNAAMLAIANQTTNTPAVNAAFIARAGQATTNVAGYFDLVGGSLSAITYTNAVLVLDNNAVAASIFVARDNGTPVVTIKDGGVQLNTTDIVIDSGTKGMVLKDTQGTPHYWRVTVSNVGALVVTDLGTTAP